MALNKVEYQAVTAKMNEINSLTEDANNNLKGINALIEENVGTSGRAWSGESAAAYKQSWDGIAANFNSFVQDFRQQSVNIQTLLKETQAVDTTEAGIVNQ